MLKSKIQNSKFKINSKSQIQMALLNFGFGICFEFWILDFEFNLARVYFNKL